MVSKKTNIARSIRQQGVLRFGILVVAVVVINLASDLFYGRFDLTKEKRFTLSEATHELINKLDDQVYIQIFLDGEFPKEYRRLQNATRDILNEYEHISKGNISFRFDDLLSDKPDSEKNDILRQLVSKGLQVTRPETGGSEEAYIIPAGMVTYKGIEYPLNILKREFGQSLDEDINGSVELLEYEIGTVLRKCVAEKSVKIAFTEGHGELEAIETADITKALSEFYDVERVNINLSDTNCTKNYLAELQQNPENAGVILMNGVMKTMNRYDALIIAKPRSMFKDEELFLLDQYVMNGGKTIWLVETLIAEMDSVSKYGSIMTANYPTNFNDLLFKYGIRVNYDLIQDMNCHGIPVLMRGGSGQPQFQPWLYYPLFAPESKHPIVRNLTSMWGRYVASLDILPNQKLNRTVLLESSHTSRLANNPVNISLDLLSLKPTKEMFRQPNNAAAVLIEGGFDSKYTHRKSITSKSPIPFKGSIDKNAMIVIGDGDFIVNQTNKEKTQVYPLGYDKYASQAFGEPVEFSNKKFFLNCVDYLCDESNLIEVRSKKIELRLLDKARVKSEKMKWQVLNMVLPIIFILLFGIVNAWLRRRRYTR